MPRGLSVTFTNYKYDIIQEEDIIEHTNDKVHVFTF